MALRPQAMCQILARTPQRQSPIASSFLLSFRNEGFFLQNERLHAVRLAFHQVYVPFSALKMRPIALIGDDEISILVLYPVETRSGGQVKSHYVDNPLEAGVNGKRRVYSSNIKTRLRLSPVGKGSWSPISPLNPIYFDRTVPQKRPAYDATNVDRLLGCI